MKPLLCLLFVLSTTLSSFAQPYCKVDHFSVNNGLSQGVVANIIQDQKGFMWFSTWNGLNKFDGYTFKNYKAFPGDKSTLTTNRFSYIAESKYGDIWCLTYDGRAYLFDNQSKEFIDILHPIEGSLQQTPPVTKIYTLKKGIAWIVCEQGYTFRVDEKACKQGEGITLYSTFNKSLKGEKILNIYQDADGDEWILTDKGINIVGKKQINSDFPFKLMQEYDGKIYLVTTSGKIASYKPATKDIKFIQIPHPINEINSIASISAKNDSICMATDNGLLLYLPQKNQFQLFDIRTSPKLSNNVVSFYRDRTGDVWLFSEDPGVIRLNLQTGEKQVLLSPPQDIVHYEVKSRILIFEDKEGTLWVVPQEGHLCYYDRKSQQLKLYFTDPHNPTSLFAPYIRFFFPDRQGNVWLITTRGVEKMSFSPHVYELNNIDNGLEIRAFLLDKQRQLWVGSKRGIVRIYHADGTLKGYLTPQGTITPQETKFSRSVYCFLEDKEGNIWLGTKKDGLLLLKKKNDQSYSVQQYLHDPDDAYSLSDNSIYSIFQDSHGRIWLGSYGKGINLISRNEDNKIQFIHCGNQLKNYPVNSSLKIRYITEVRNGILMVGTTHGLLTFSAKFDQPEEIKFYHNVRDPEAATSLGSNDVTYIYTDSSQRIYVTTFTGGINQVVSSNLLSDNIVFKSYTIRDGLASDLVLSMIEDGQKKLWVVSENALSIFDPVKGSFDNFISKHIANELNFSEAIPSLDNKQRLLFGTDHGVLKINPSQMKKSSYVPPIVFTDLKIQGSQRRVAIDDVKELTLEPSERNVTFQFAAIDYANPEDIRYSYRLKGLEKEWNDADKNRSATYINLPPGEYQLQICSTNSDGAWTDNLRTLDIKVLPTFWETYWAWIFYVLLFALFTSAIVYILFYIYRLRHQVDVEQQLSNIKLRFFTDISHELRTPLTLISSPLAEVLDREPLSPTAKGHLLLVHKNTERMLRLVNQILDFRKIQNKKMKVLAEQIEIVSLVDKIMENFRMIAEEKDISFELQAAQDSLYVWADKDKFEKILFNLLSNAFKYTPAGKSVTVHVKTIEDKLQIVVSDEGIGIDRDKQKSLFQRFETLGRYNILQPSSGIGLSLVRELIELHHGSIEINSEPGVGSEFIVNLPLDKKVLEEDKQVEFILTDSITNTLAEQTAAPQNLYEDEDGMEQEATLNDEEAFSILIVEDNQELRTFLKNILSENYIVLEATNGEEGAEIAQEQIPDLIVSDIMMPVMDGLDMVKAIKENNDTCHIPIILLSAKSSLDDRIAGLEQGIDDYITKPFSSTYLRTRITSLLKQRKQLQEMYLAQLAGKKVEESDNYEAEPARPQITPYDELFMQQVMEFMEEQMDNTDLTVDDFADKLMLSRTVFYRKLKSIVGLTPVDFIRDIRIKRSIQLIESGEYNFSQVAYMIGFSDPKYFSKCFKKQTGLTPSEYKDQAQLSTHSTG